MIDPNAPVTILEYGDFECPYCAMAAPVLERIVVVGPDFRGVQDGVNGTPTLLINRVRYDGPREYDAILSAIAAVAGAREL